MDEKDDMDVMDEMGETDEMDEKDEMVDMGEMDGIDEKDDMNVTIKWMKLMWTECGINVKSIWNQFGEMDELD